MKTIIEHFLLYLGFIIGLQILGTTFSDTALADTVLEDIATTVPALKCNYMNGSTTRKYAFIEAETRCRKTLRDRCDGTLKQFSFEKGGCNSCSVSGNTWFSCGGGCLAKCSTQTIEDARKADDELNRQGITARREMLHNLFKNEEEASKKKLNKSYDSFDARTSKKSLTNKSANKSELNQFASDISNQEDSLSSEDCEEYIEQCPHCPKPTSCFSHIWAKDPRDAPQPTYIYKSDTQNKGYANQAPSTFRSSSTSGNKEIRVRKINGSKSDPCEGLPTPLPESCLPWTAVPID